MARFQELLGACPVARADDHVGASVRRSASRVSAARAARAREDEEGAAALAAARKSTAKLERAAKEARRMREAEAGSARGKGAAVRRRGAAGERAPLVKSGAAADAELAVKAYYKRMRAHLGSSPSFSAQQVEAVVQRFKVLTAAYLSQLSLEDIDDLGRRSLAE